MFKRGFTIIELMLSMTFISILLIAVATLTIHMSNLYTRGITMRQVSTAGQELANNIQRNIQSTQGIDLNNNYVVFMNNSVNPRVKRGQAAYDAMNDVNEAKKIMGGRLCVGGTTYAWNNGSYLKNFEAGGSTDSPNVVGDKPVHLVKATGVNLCPSGNSLAPFNSSSLDAASSTEDLLSNGDRQLAIHKFLISSVTNKGLYSISFTIGTSDVDALESGSESCKPPSDTGSDENYCSVNRFDVIARSIPQSGGATP